MKTYGEWRYSYTILDLVTKWRRVVNFTPRPVYPVERAPGAHCIGGWVGPRAGLDAVKKRKISFSCRESNPDHPAVTPRYTHRTIPALSSCNCLGNCCEYPHEHHYHHCHLAVREFAC
jgi:hypothetical protein